MKYVALWSPSQKCFHVETKEEMLERNIAQCMRNSCADYITLGIYPTREECNDLIELIKKRRAA